MGLSLKNILRTVAPTLAAALPGPLGGVAKKVITDLLGKPETTTDDEIAKVLATANPDMLLRLKQLDADFQAKMAAIGVDLEKLAAEDKASARAMQISTRAKTPAVLSTVIVGGWIGLMAFLLFFPVPAGNMNLLMRALGILDAALITILTFYFGSSLGSMRKTELMKDK